MQIYGKTLKHSRIFPNFCNFAGKFNKEMKYYEVTFNIKGAEELQQTACDVFASMAAEAGFETFEECENGLKGYVQQNLFDRSALDGIIEDFPLPFSISYTVEEAEDKDWNEQWEKEGFMPICIQMPVSRGEGVLAIHDGRHLPEKMDMGIEIDAHLAFGTGTHETTRMIVTSLLDLDLNNKRFLDCGTGTGILAITALKLGASEAIGYDIDEWSVDNARHNAVINRVDDHFQSYLGDAKVLDDAIQGHFDIITANINRNILLADMPAFVGKMKEHAILILSGFYEDDIEILTRKATELGLQKKAQRLDDHWACLVFEK